MKNETLPSVAIVIPAYNEEQTISHCLESCINQTRKPDEIIVVNNKSTDRTVDIVTQFQHDHPDYTVILLHQNDVQGLIPTRNHGFNTAKSDVIGRIDADSRITPEWVQEVACLFADPLVDAATGPVIYHDMPAKQAGANVDKQVRHILHRLARNHRFLFGSNMALRSTAWQKISHEVCLDEANLMHEDIDIALHLYQQGFNIVFEPKMVGGMSARRLSDSPRQFYNYIMRFERTFKSHNLKSAAARIPIFIYLSTYFPLKLIYGAYDAENDRLSLKKLLTTIPKEDHLDNGPRL